ncbi:hypothetical protein ACFV3R_18850 [Streptomyces sp. NPDC059740]|uniref:Rv1733c family protein n=1 Tax=Streptomyces sp. NPDC059740 TaxID=3346926 RepID=UPI003657C04A
MTAPWRHRGNPLVRRRDRVQGWVGVCAAAVVALGGPVAGAVSGLAVADGLAGDRARLTPVTADLRRDVPSDPGAPDGAPTMRAPVTYRTPSGRLRHAEAYVTGGLAAHSRVTVWLDARGRTQPPPPEPTDVALVSSATGSGMFACVAVLAGGGYRLVRGHLAAGREREWGREWDETEAGWTGRG